MSPIALSSTESYSPAKYCLSEIPTVKGSAPNADTWRPPSSEYVACVTRPRPWRRSWDNREKSDVREFKCTSLETPQSMKSGAHWGPSGRHVLMHAETLEPRRSVTFVASSVMRCDLDRSLPTSTYATLPFRPLVALTCRSATLLASQRPCSQRARARAFPTADVSNTKSDVTGSTYRKRTRSPAVVRVRRPFEGPMASPSASPSASSSASQCGRTPTGAGTDAPLLPMASISPAPGSLPKREPRPKGPDTRDEDALRPDARRRRPIWPLECRPRERESRRHLAREHPRVDADGGARSSEGSRGGARSEGKAGSG